MSQGVTTLLFGYAGALHSLRALENIEKLQAQDRLKVNTPTNLMSQFATLEGSLATCTLVPVPMAIWGLFWKPAALRPWARHFCSSLTVLRMMHMPFVSPHSAECSNLTLPHPDRQFNQLKNQFFQQTMTTQ
eukprot:5097667-Amphidinium_carterae.1